MLLKKNCALWAISNVISAAVFLSKDDAHLVLDRARRANSGYFEEVKQGNLERECVEEICNYEEAREVFEDDAQTKRFWLTYTGQDPCLVNPCKNNGTCVYMDDSYTCQCLEGYEGKYCQTVFEDTLKCLSLNGECEHFCNSSGSRRKCSCAPGYALGEDGRECVAQVQYPCGKIPGLEAPMSQARVKLVGGNHCPKGACPWQVLLEHKGTSLCGGVIVHPDWVITAAHCVVDRDTKDLMVVAGEHNIDVEEGSEQRIPVARAIPYNLYDPATGDSDIALLRLRGRVTLGPDAVPICLPQQHFAKSELAAVRFHTLSGWGKRTNGGNDPKPGTPPAPSSRFLRRLAVPILPNSECTLKSGFNFTQNMLCAGYMKGNQEACRGYDGSPLVTYYGTTHFLMGVVGWGKGCPKQGFYGVYTAVANYLDWAEEVMNTPSVVAPVPSVSAPVMPFLLEMALDEVQIQQATEKLLPPPSNVQSIG
ncbi:coagulation factor VII [Oncorhynchus mykiss]|nr:coagulation factor VII [Oncorhynchus mykiss]